jgi:hypothetical protein
MNKKKQKGFLFIIFINHNLMGWTSHNCSIINVHSGLSPSNATKQMKPTKHMMIKHARKTTIGSSFMIVKYMASCVCVCGCGVGSVFSIFLFDFFYKKNIFFCLFFIYQTDKACTTK